MAFSCIALALFAAPDEGGQAVTDFKKCVDDYVKVRQQAAQGLQPLKEPRTPGQVAAHQKTLAERIQNARATARRGDIFAPAASYLLQIVESEFRGKAGSSALKATKEGDPKVETPAQAPTLKINTVYPDAASISTMPPTLLLRLPQLPKELEYRFVGNNLILLDLESMVIVDYLPRATAQ